MGTSARLQPNAIKAFTEDLYGLQTVFSVGIYYKSELYNYYYVSMLK